MWEKSWRSQVWSHLDREWDIIIIGGGITGAGILREASRCGIKTLLVEAKDFASGTSSRSSKLVHGGFRYLKNFQFRVTMESVAERDNLLHEGKGLVHKLEVLFASQKGDKIPGWQMGIGLILYGLMAHRWQYSRSTVEALEKQYPLLNTSILQGGYPYFDAQTDDARLTLRVIREAVRSGGVAINYAEVIGLLRENSGKVCGVVLKDNSPDSHGATVEVKAKLVVNATGAWADELRDKINLPGRLRPLRGSHLVFSSERLPLISAVSLNHPRDGRPVFAFPWEGVTIAGTTDVDIDLPVCTDPVIGQEEAHYLLEFIQAAFPKQELTMKDVISTWSGIRPVINTGKTDPSKESREHAIWYENGLLTVTGGKLTTFRIMARDALRAARKVLPACPGTVMNLPVLDPLEMDTLVMLSEYDLTDDVVMRLAGRYGADSVEILPGVQPKAKEMIGVTPYLWAELDWAARSEGVVHLDDLLMRRVRLGILLPDGGRSMMAEIRTIVQAELYWNDMRWQNEEERYFNIWQNSYQINGDI